MRFMPALAMSSALVLAACAQAPEAIMPAYTSEVPYLSWTCQHLAEEVPRLNNALATASVAQQQARSNDIAGVILLGLPVGSLSGQNIAPQIARLRGEVEAVERAMRRNNCAVAIVPPAPAPETRPAGV